MSEDTTVTGEIRIDPPIPWSRLFNERWTLADRDVVVRVEPYEKVIDGETWTRHQGVAIVPERQNQSAYHLVEHLQAIVDEFGTEGRTFTGYLTLSWAGEQGSVWRVMVRDGRAVEVRPKLTWPGDEPSGYEPATDAEGGALWLNENGYAVTDHGNGMLRYEPDGTWLNEPLPSWRRLYVAKNAVT